MLLSDLSWQRMQAAWSVPGLASNRVWNQPVFHSNCKCNVTAGQHPPWCSTTEPSRCRPDQNKALRQTHPPNPHNQKMVWLTRMRQLMSNCVGKGVPEHIIPALFHASLHFWKLVFNQIVPNPEPHLQHRVDQSCGSVLSMPPQNLPNWAWIKTKQLYLNNGSNIIAHGFIIFEPLFQTFCFFFESMIWHRGTSGSTNQATMGSFALVVRGNQIKRNAVDDFHVTKPGNMSQERKSHTMQKKSEKHKLSC